MRAANTEEKDKWMEVLKQEIEKVLAEHQGAKDTVKSGKGAFSSSAIIQALSPSQRSRNDCYKQERDVVQVLPGVAEALCFKERDMPKLIIKT
eukprot:14254671-Ditylum_brightwellii.AAC.1